MHGLLQLSQPQPGPAYIEALAASIDDVESSIATTKQSQRASYADLVTREQDLEAEIAAVALALQDELNQVGWLVEPHPEHVAARPNLATVARLWHGWRAMPREYRLRAGGHCIRVRRQLSSHGNDDQGSSFRLRPTQIQVGEWTQLHTCIVQHMPSSYCMK